MARHIWSITCLQVITDTETNSVSIINAVESLDFSKIPEKLPPIMVSTLWRREKVDEVFKVRISVKTPSGREAIRKETNDLLFKDFMHYRVNVQVAGIVADGPGDYLFIVEKIQDGEATTETTIPVNVVETKTEVAAETKAEPAKRKTKRKAKA